VLPDVSRLDGVVGRRLAEVLEKAKVDAAYLREHSAGPDDLRSALSPSRIAQLRDDPCDVLFRLWFCQEEVQRALVEPLLGPVLGEVIETGLLLDEGESLVAPFHLRLVRGLLLFSDYLDFHSEGAVMGAGETTAVLYSCSRPATRVGSALDLGCGAGTLALLLAADADRVLGTDINERAVALATFNAAVNGLSNVEFRAGDMWQPVGDEQFDLIVSQPPYYPRGTAAEADQTFLHGGERGDELARRVVAGVPEHLRPAGRAFVFASWPEAADSPHPPDLQTLELTTNRREVHGTRQSLNVYAQGPAWCSKRRIAADEWARLRAADVEEMLAGERLVEGPDQDLLSAKLRLTDEAEIFEEGSQTFVRGRLIGHQPVSREEWRTLRAIDSAAQAGDATQDTGFLRRALRDNLLRVA
jgi:SAM-dependent methyltransferase